MFGSCQIFTRVLGMKYVAPNIVPKLLKFWAKTTPHGHHTADVDNVQRRSSCARKCHNWWWIIFVKSPIIPEDPRPKKPHQDRSDVKVLFTIFFDCNGVVHHEFLSQDRKVNTEYYLEVMRRLRKVNRQKCPEFWKAQSSTLHRFDRTVNREYYLEVMHRLRKINRQKRPEFWKTQSSILHQFKHRCSWVRF